MDIELIIAATFITFLGLPHGALDPLVAYQHGLIGRASHWVYFLIAYIGSCLLGLLFWYLSPVSALVLFLSYSAVHFGRDWSGSTSLGGSPYGCLVLGLPAIFHPAEIQDIYLMLTSEPTSASVLMLNRGFLLFGGGYLVMTMLFRQFKSLTRYAWLELIALASCAYLCIPLWYFVIFFCALHSPRHLIAELGALSRPSKMKAVAVMTVFTLITVGCIALFGAQLRVSLNEIETFTYQAIFIGLAVLTIPHMFLMEWVRSRALKTTLLSLK